jgi:hypothetical protein
MNRIFDILCVHGFRIMLLGAGIIAITVFVSIAMMQRGGAKNPYVWWIVGTGGVVYLAGRVGVAMQRDRLRKKRSSQEPVFEPHEEQSSS